MSAQSEMFAEHRQPRQPFPENPSTYEAVLKMRRKGFTVYRHGMHHHKVGDKIVTSYQLIWLSRCG